MNSASKMWQVIWRFIRPEIEELAIYVMVIISMGILAFYDVLVRKNPDSTGGVSEALSLVQDKFAFITSGDDVAAKIFTFGTWFVIGTALYALAWFIISFSSGAFKEVAVTRSYIHPRTFDKSNYWASVIGRVVLRTAAGVSFIIYCSIWISLLAPVWLASYTDSFSSFSLSALGSLALTMIGIGLSLHVGAVLLRIVLLRSRYFYQR